MKDYEDVKDERHFRHPVIREVEATIWPQAVETTMNASASRPWLNPAAFALMVNQPSMRSTRSSMCPVCDS